MVQLNQMAEMKMNYSHELAVQKESLDQQLRQVTDDVEHYKHKCTRLQSELMLSQDQVNGLKETERKVKEECQNKIQEM